VNSRRVRRLLSIRLIDRSNGITEGTARDMHILVLDTDGMDTHLFRDELDRIIAIIEIAGNDKRLNSSSFDRFSYTISQLSKCPDGLVTYALISNGDVPRRENNR
jgi:hypothetical protein